MLEKEIPKTCKLIKKVIKKEVKNEKHLKNKTFVKNKEKQRRKTRGPGGACGARGHYKIKDRR